ncbi:hypothetical protein G6L07_08265 [Agrobacterium rhizogenes]|nr:hypothetical protein [Rhizobium rhizogenes]
MTDQPVQEFADLTAQILDALKHVSTAVTNDKSDAIEFRTRIVRLVQLTQDLNDSNTQHIRALDSLVMALIAELAITKGVDPERVAERHLAKMQETPILFSKQTSAHQRHVAEHLSHPGFPDQVPAARGGIPTLIVDNDLPDS